jgi:siroheme synthase
VVALVLLATKVAIKARPPIQAGPEVAAATQLAAMVVPGLQPAMGATAVMDAHHPLRGRRSPTAVVVAADKTVSMREARTVRAVQVVEVQAASRSAARLSPDRLERQTPAAAEVVALNKS